MQSKNILFIGFGDLAERTCRLLAGHNITGVTRSPKITPKNARIFWGEIGTPTIMDRLNEETFDAVVITLTPKEFSEAGYARAYIEPVQALLQIWKTRCPGKVLFVSSTSVYHQSNGEVVDEQTPVEPQHFSGRCMRAAELLLLSSGVPVSIIRMAGIYGPGRDALIRKVKAGDGGSSQLTNRIHVDDCAGILAHLLNRHFAGLPLEPVYLGCDSLPSVSAEVHDWVAKQLGVCLAEPSVLVKEQGGHKACSNALVVKSGYSFIHPTYREGYGSLLSSEEVSSASGAVNH